MTREWLEHLTSKVNEIEVLPPATAEVLEAADQALGGLPEGLKHLLRLSNGLVCRSFRLYSAFDPTNAKKTWESLQRANDAANTRALGGDSSLLSRFLVFADIGNGHGLWDRGDGSIWFEEAGDDQVHQTDLDLPRFVELMATNAE